MGETNIKSKLLPLDFVVSLRRELRRTLSRTMGEGRVGVLGLRNDSQRIARILRKRLTNAERVLWIHLRAKKLEGFKFRRQEPIGKYVVDFVCFEKSIIVEVDGSQHCEDRDGNRDRWFERQGFKVLRFWNNEVLNNTQGVMQVIRDRCLSHPPLTPPIKGGEANWYTHRKA